jgi:cell division septum initiation protein DivIVA
VESESAKAFTRTFRGYQPTAVDAHIEMLTTKQQLLLDDVESLRTRLKEVGDEATNLRREVGLLTETSPSPHAVQQRMAQMLRRAVDEVSEMQAEARAEADAMVAAAEAEAKAAEHKHKEALAELAERREALEAEYQKTKDDLETELAGLRADAQEKREHLLADAKLEADHYREQARRAADEASQRRIDVLEQLVGVYRDLEGVPATLESAYQELKNPSE